MNQRKFLRNISDEICCCAMGLHHIAKVISDNDSHDGGHKMLVEAIAGKLEVIEDNLTCFTRENIPENKLPGNLMV